MKEIIEELKEKFPNIEINLTEKSIICKAEKSLLIGIAKELKKNFEHLSAIIGVEYENNYEVVYEFFSYKNLYSLELRIQIDKNEPNIQSLTSLWLGAEYHEREAYDMFGITFEGNKNLERVLLPKDWSLFPLRKEFKLGEKHG
ncbi:MAG: NADH-quinone oxidoreductase subunit C [Candidatus Thermoplasmatota archaeon]